MSAMSDSNGHDDMPIENAEKIIEMFGGIRPMANKMGVPVTTVQGWKKRNVIPGNRRDQVMQAAKTNNIDLSDLIAGAANENSFRTEMAAVPKSESAEKKHEEAIELAEKNMIKASPRPRTNDDMFDEMRRAQSMTFTKSAWFSGFLVAAVSVIALMLLIPSKQQLDQNTSNIAQNTQNIASVQGDVSGMRERITAFKGLLPTDLGQKLEYYQQQSQKLETTVKNLGERVDIIAKDVMEPNIPVSERISRAGEYATMFGAPEQLTSMLQKVQGLQTSLDGQTHLSSVVAELNMIFSKSESDEDLQQALMQAQQEDDALGYALEGVAQDDLKAAALLLGLAQFRSTLNRNAPFEEDLALMQNMLGEDDPELQQAISKLAPKASAGVLTPEGLKGEFKGLAGDIVVASLKGEDVSIQERAKARFNDVLSVEKDGELITGTDTQAKVARAQRYLDEGNIEAALGELQSLEGEASNAAQPFIQEAELTMIAQHLQGMFTKRTVGEIGLGKMLSGAGVKGGSAIGAGALGDMAKSLPTDASDLKGLVGEIQKLAPRRVIHDEASGFRILEPKPKILP